jgi:signal transduction histidine kinase
MEWEPSKERFLSAIVKAVNGARALTSHLLALSRKRLECVQPAVVVPEMCNFARLALPSTVQLMHEAVPDAWHINIDVSELELAIINLVVNARDAIGGQGVITVRVRNISSDSIEATEAVMRHGDFVAISVQDTGAGIPEALLGRIFEPFFTTKAEGKGTGLGLSRVYKYAQDLGGTVVAKNCSGGGALITVYVPRAASTAPSDGSDDRLEIKTAGLTRGQGEGKGLDCIKEKASRSPR